MIRTSAALGKLPASLRIRQRDLLRIVVVMVVVLLVLVPPGAPDHPGGDPEDDDSGRQLQVGFAAFSGEILAEVEPQERDRPDHTGVRDRRRKTQQRGLKNGAADRDDEGGHHRLGMAGLKPM